VPRTLEPTAAQRASDPLGDEAVLDRSHHLSTPLPSDGADAVRTGNDHLEALEGEVLLSSGRNSSILDYHTAAIKAGAFKRAEAVFTQVLRLGAKSRQLQFLLIDVLLRQEKFVEAMDGIETAMSEFGADDGILKAALSVRSRIPQRNSSNSESRVSLCMIVKNERQHLARCLQSVKSIVDEMILVDTGSTDRSQDIGIAFGARVLNAAWEDDFSKSRNAALSEARGQWILVLDADEVISPNDINRFRALVGRSGIPSVAYRIQTRNYSYRANTVAWRANDRSYPHEEQGIGWFPSDKVRLFPNHPGIRFSFPVHELVEPSLNQLNIPICNCSIPVHHYGKLKETKTFEKTQGYRALGEKKLDESPMDPLALREIAIQSSHLGRHAEACGLWQRYLDRVPQSAEAYVNLGSSCWQQGRYAEALEHARAAQRIDPTLKEAAFNRALAELLLGDASAAGRTTQRLLRKEPKYLPARFIQAAAYACNGNTAQAMAALRFIETTPLGAHLAESFYEIARRLLDAPQRSYCEKLLRVAIAGKHGDSRLTGLLAAVQSA